MTSNQLDELERLYAFTIDMTQTEDHRIFTQESLQLVLGELAPELLQIAREVERLRAALTEIEDGVCDHGYTGCGSECRTIASAALEKSK